MRGASQPLPPQPIERDMRGEISPRTSDDRPHRVGKTEIARPGKLVDAPFIKVGGHEVYRGRLCGRRDPSSATWSKAIRMVKEQHGERVRLRAQVLAEDRILDLICIRSETSTPSTSAGNRSPGARDPAGGKAAPSAPARRAAPEAASP